MWVSSFRQNGRTFCSFGAAGWGMGRRWCWPGRRQTAGSSPCSAGTRYIFHPKMLRETSKKAKDRMVLLVAPAAGAHDLPVCRLPYTLAP